MQLSSEDTIFAITSAGDNVLHYAINSKPRRIHAVDMNPWWVDQLANPGSFLIVSLQPRPSS